MPALPSRLPDAGAFAAALILFFIFAAFAAMPVSPPLPFLVDTPPPIDLPLCAFHIFAAEATPDS